MDRRPPGARVERPFFTLRSLLVFFVVSLAAIFVSQALGQTQTPQGVAAAAVDAVGLVCFGLTWAGGLVFAWRARSLFWFFAVCFLGPPGSLVCAWFYTSMARRSGRR